jgi:galactose oxidase-like protein
MKAGRFTRGGAAPLVLLALALTLASERAWGQACHPSDGEWTWLMPVTGSFGCSYVKPVIVPSRQLVLAFLVGPECPGINLGAVAFARGLTPLPVEGDPTGGHPLDGTPLDGFYDPLNDRVFYFFLDDWDGSSFTNLTTWTLSLGDTLRWERLETVGALPPSGGGGSLVLDIRHGRVVMFGGTRFEAGRWIAINEVWSFSIADLRWSRLTPAGPEPPGRIWHSAVYDLDRDRMLVFGGRPHEGSPFADLWALSLGNHPRWTRIEPEGEGPPARSMHGAIYDSRARRMLIVGGSESVLGRFVPLHVWELSLHGRLVWRKLDPGTTPRFGPRLPAAAYDPDHDRMLIGNLYNLWSLQWDWLDGPAPPRRDPGPLAAQGTTPGSAITAPNALRGAHEGVEVRLYDIAGRVVLARNVPDVAAWLDGLRAGSATEAAGLAPGVYFAQRGDRPRTLAVSRILLLKR